MRTTTTRTWFSSIAVAVLLLLSTGVAHAVPVQTARPTPHSGASTQVSDSASTPFPGTDAILEANAWNCNLYVDKCDFATSAKALRSGGEYTVDTITNVATIKANGISATISTSPSGTFVNEATRQITWTKNNSWISDISGIADPGGTFNTSITTCSDASGFVDGVKAFASACTFG